MAVTVDDLPAHGSLPPNMTREQIVKDFLKVLKKHKVPEVYAFANAGRHPDKLESEALMKMWVAGGYPLANHTFMHPRLKNVTAPEFIKDIEDNESTLQKLNGQKNWKYFRYPYLHEGDTLEKRNAIRQYLKSKNYTIAQVTVDFEDWAWNNPYARCMTKKDKKSVEWLQKTYLESAETILDRAVQSSDFVFKKPISHILLLHFGAFDAAMLDQLLTAYEKKGVEFISLSEAVRDDVYGIDPGLTFTHGAEFQYQVLKSRNQSAKDAGLAPFTGVLDQLDGVCAK